VSTQTPNLHLVKPGYAETVDVGVINSNMDLIDDAYGEVLNHVYPVGSIYMSVVSTSPAELFGGTWEQLKDRFLLGAGDTYTAGDTGGAANHTLTVDEMPSHNHSFTGSAVTSGDISANHTHTGTSGNPSANHTHSGPNHNHYTRYSKSTWRGAGPGTILHVDGNGEHYEYNANGYSGTGATGGVSAWHTHTTTTGNQSSGHTHSVTAEGSIGNTGSGTAFSIMNPYLAVYMWKRTA
jgi:microcystin-dependent protein